MNQQIIPSSFAIFNNLKMNLKNPKKVGKNEILILIDNYHLEKFEMTTSPSLITRTKKHDEKTLQQLRKKKVDLLNRNLILFINDEILLDSTPDGVYSWILYKVNINKYMIVFSPVESLVEFSNKHSNMNLIAFERGLIPTRIEFDLNQEKKVKKSQILYAGEVLKKDKDLTFNFLSGTYSFNIKQEFLSQQQKPDVERKKWFPSLLKILEDKLFFPISSGSSKSKGDCTIHYTTENLITWEKVPFRKENYVLIQPLLEGRFVLLDNLKTAKELRKIISRHYNELFNYDNLPAKFKKGTKPKLPEELKTLNFLDKKKPQTKATVKSPKKVKKKIVQ